MTVWQRVWLLPKLSAGYKYALHEIFSLLLRMSSDMEKRAKNRFYLLNNDVEEQYTMQNDVGLEK